jgi:hypothetical protein
MTNKTHETKQTEINESRKNPTPAPPRLTKRFLKRLVRYQPENNQVFKIILN